MRVKVQTRLHAEPDRVWQAVQKPALLQHVSFPLIVFIPLGASGDPHAPFPDGRSRVFMLAFAVLPFGRQWIDVSRHWDGGPVRRLRDNGAGDLVRRWDHWITIAPHPEGGTEYVDEVEIEAGVLTPLVWAFAHLFYRWRQHRWRGLVRRGLAL